jgi:hypothetical protein
MDVLSAAASVAGVAALGVGAWQLAVAVMDRRDARRRNTGLDESYPVDGALPVAAPYGRLPFDVVGREELKAELGQVLSRHRSVASKALVLAGMGGAGKSTAALWLASRFRARGRPVWWVNAADPVALRGAVVEILRRLGAPESLVREVSEGAPTAADRFWVFLDARMRRSGRALLVLDNADVPAVLAADGVSIPADGTGWVRAGRGVVTVVTTRVGDPGIWGGGARVFPVPVLSKEAAVAILHELAPQIADPSGLEAPALAWRLGTLPLALRLAGAYLSSPFARSRSFADYRRALDTGEAAVTELDAADADPRVMVSRTWELSLDALADQGMGQARELLYVLACFASSTPIPASLVPERDGVEHALRGLAALALVEVASVPDGRPDVTLHPVLADTCRARMVTDGSVIPKTAVRLVHDAAESLDAGRPSDWPQSERLFPHVRALLMWSPSHLGHHDSDQPAPYRPQGPRLAVARWQPGEHGCGGVRPARPGGRGQARGPAPADPRRP